MIFGKVRDIFFLFSISLFTNQLPAQNVLPVHEPEPFDIIISEIMADPVPAVSLPEYEYIEIVNTSGTAISLKNWLLTAGSYVVSLPDSVLSPGEYAVVTDFSAANLFPCRIIPVKMPHITNTGQVTTLKSPGGSIIHSVNFSDDWYNDPDKDDGGWSVEIIDMDNPCAGKNNWKASADSKGGTPGLMNSVTAKNPDLFSPVLMNASLTSDTTLLLHFNESLNRSALYESGRYSVDYGYYHPDYAIPVAPGYSDILLQYRRRFQPGIIYTITVLDMTDCVGNHPHKSQFTSFAFAENARQQDVVINEVLFKANHSIEFIELFNRSEKVIDLSSLIISLADENSVIYKSVRLTKYPIPMFPQKYAVITRYADDVALRYKNLNLQTIIEQPGLFSLPDDAGLIVLSDTAGQIIDECTYDEDIHFELLTDASDISLERVDPNNSSDDIRNWHSASYLSGYSTPGIVNSQSVTANENDFFMLSPEFLSPDADGVDDEMIVRFSFKEPGWMGTILIYTLNGIKTKTLISNSLVGTNESVIWDGRDETGTIAEPGLYLVCGEFYHSRGSNKNFKKVIPVVKK